MLKIAINVPFVGKDEISAVTNILKNGALTSAANHGGEYVQAFEKSASLFIKSKYVIAANSGTAALQAALYALDIKKGDEVLVPSFTFVATANSVVSTGAKPVFVDILKENNMFVYSPQGAIYMLIDISQSGMSSHDFTMSLLEKEKVAVSPGDTFGSQGSDYIRICFAASEDNLKEALRRICRHVKS